MKPLEIKILIVAILVCFIHSTSLAQTEPRMVLPIGHTLWVNSAVFSPDGRLALTQGLDKTARIYDVATGRELQLLSDITAEFGSAIFSPDGKMAVVNIDDYTSNLYDVISGKKLKVFVGHKSEIRSTAFSADGKMVITSSSDSTARIFEVETGKELRVLRGHTSWVNSGVFSRDGKLVITSSWDSTARIFEVATGKQLQVLRGHSDGILSAVFSADDKLALTAGDSTARVYEVTTGRELRVLLSQARHVNSAKFSPDGKLALIAGDSTAHIFEIDSGKELHALIGQKNKISSVEFNFNGNLVLMASWDNTARIYDVATGNELQILRGHERILGSAVFSPNGKLVLTASNDETARIYEVATGKELQVLGGHTVNVDSNYSPDGKFIKAEFGSQEICGIYEVSSGKELIAKGSSFDFHEFIMDNTRKDSRFQYWLFPISHDPRDRAFSFDLKLSFSKTGIDKGVIYESTSYKKLLKLKLDTSKLVCAEFNPFGNIIMTAHNNGSSYIYDVSSGKRIRVLMGPKKEITSALFSPNGEFVLTACQDSIARIFDVSNGKMIHAFAGHTERINSAFFSPKGEQVYTYCQDSIIRIFDVSSGKLLHALSEHTNEIQSSTFSPDGKLLLTNSSDSKSRIWDVTTGKEILLISDDTRNSTPAKFSPDGSLVIKESKDFSFRVWEVKSASELYHLSKHKSYINTLEFSPDGKYILSSSWDRKTILWETSTGKPLYTRLQLTDNDWLVYDEDYRFDGTPGAIEKLYFTCGLEVIDLAQMKDSLWVPGLADKIMNNREILINDKLAPKLSDLNICDLTPVIEPIEQENKKILKYRITPRNGGLGNTEVYINGNLTYTLKPQQLLKVKEDKKEVYYLTLSTDTLQQYLTGKKNDENPIVVKSKVKGSGIYGRGVSLELEKNTDEEPPQFYGVFVGVNDYGNPQKTGSESRYRNLDYAAKDANDLSLAVEKTAGNLFQSDSHIYRLTGTGNEAPTKENLQRVLAEIGEKSKASDILYIFFAGHGDIKKGKNEDGQEQDQIRFMLMNADKANPFTTSFGVEELTKWCSPQKIKAQKRVFVFDACHSGKIIDQTMAFNGRGDDEGARIRQLDKLKDKNGMMILAAAADDESAYEDETLNQGVLTYHLLQVMKEHNDTLLVVRNWFDETIDLVKDYSKANGNKQEPSSFGDGRFEIGNVNQDVREAIKITCPKTRVGACVFTANAATKLQYPNVKQRVNDYFLNKVRGDQFIYSKNIEKAYRTEGFYSLANSKIQVTYDLFKGEELIESNIELTMKKYNSEDELVAAILNSITQEIEKLNLQDDPCKFNSK
jgi:WD40 repeat protein